MVLWALAEAAALTGDLNVEFGNRALAVATGLDQSTVGRALNRLLAEPLDRRLIDRVREAHGVRAHTWSLRIPPLLAPAVAAKPWRRGRIHAIRPAFRETRPDRRVRLRRTGATGRAHQRPRARPARRRQRRRDLRRAQHARKAWGLVDRIPAGWTLSPTAATTLQQARRSLGHRRPDPRADRAVPRRAPLLVDPPWPRRPHPPLPPPRPGQTRHPVRRRTPDPGPSPNGGHPPSAEDLVAQVLGGTLISTNSA
ncbi:hypothetical protein G5V59_27380 [Nocardioides sp. W3-2-3]|uniref:hypothetical protein n=1 Tax=Nocardioides convexus TaxID=2712224 RepID=UPI0024181EA7|nr:hypothetical protein [Nocardioides convexus]NHA02105.1 hypothetical protein [Nocardioides convexus]